MHWKEKKDGNLFFEPPIFLAPPQNKSWGRGGAELGREKTKKEGKERKKKFF